MSVKVDLKWKVGLNGLWGHRGQIAKLPLKIWPSKCSKYIPGAKLGFGYPLFLSVSHDVSMSKKWHELLWLGSHFTIVNGFAIKVQWSSPSRVKLPRFRKHYLTAKVFPKVPSKANPSNCYRKSGLRIKTFQILISFFATGSYSKIWSNWVMFQSSLTSPNFYGFQNMLLTLQNQTAPNFSELSNIMLSHWWSLHLTKHLHLTFMSFSSWCSPN